MYHSHVGRNLRTLNSTPKISNSCNFKRNVVRGLHFETSRPARILKVTYPVHCAGMYENNEQVLTDRAVVVGREAIVLTTGH